MTMECYDREVGIDFVESGSGTDAAFCSYFYGVERPEFEADHSHPCGVEN
jgi:hypothetical protein